MNPEDADPTFRRFNTRIERWGASAIRMVDDTLNIAHIPYVHRKTIRSYTQEIASTITREQLDRDFSSYRYEVTLDYLSKLPRHLGLSRVL